MLFYYELKCTDSTGFYFYYYFYCNKPIRLIKTALNSGYAPDKLRLLIDDTYKTPVAVRRLSLFEYLYLKKFKRHFYLGWRKIGKKNLKDCLTKISTIHYNRVKKERGATKPNRVIRYAKRCRGI